MENGALTILAKELQARRSAGRQPTSRMRAQVASIAAEYFRGGRTVFGLAMELGIRESTLWRWLKTYEDIELSATSPSPVAVDVLDGETKAGVREEGITVTLPSGIAVSGLSIDEALRFVEGANND